MTLGRVEMRRGRRVAMEVPVTIRQWGPAGPGPVIRQEAAKNVSLTGVYFETDDASVYRLNDAVVACVSVPEDRTREFPFARLDGCGRVARLFALGHAGAPRFGVALEFGDDVTTLAALPR